MSDLIDSAFDQLNTEMETHFGETVTYARGATTAAVTAVWNAGRQEFDILKTALTAAFTAPAQGDLITRADGSVYDVVLEYTDDNGVQLPAYDIADGSGTIWRIHVEPVQS